LASLGSLVAGEKLPMISGGFYFSVPVSAGLSRAAFMKAALWDMACCIKENFEVLNEVSPHGLPYVWACGGGFQSALLRRFITGLIQKPLRIATGFEQASVTGAALILSEALSSGASEELPVQSIEPEQDFEREYRQWKAMRCELTSKNKEAAPV